MDTSAFIKLVFELIGGLGIFLLGMKHMSEGMQAVAGNSLRKMIGAVTNNRVFATIVGVVVTCVVQSSSITTVMVVGFVNSGVMQLSQAIGVIMGANVGTTVTGWILVLKIGKYGLPLLGSSAFIYLFAKGERWRYWAMSLMGVGMIFFGLELMKDACSIIRDIPEFETWFQTFQADSYVGVLQCAMVGCVLTCMVQSSSATLGITITLAFEGIIPYETAAALVLGENIGTTITAFLASLGATTNARRAAYFHIIFNVLGVVWITLIFQWYTQAIIPAVAGADISQSVLIDEDGNALLDDDSKPIALADVDAADVEKYRETYPNTTLAIAATHTIFNIVNTLMFLPFLPLFVKFLNWLVPAKAFKEKPHLTDLDIHMLETPMLAIEQSQKELEKMGAECLKMLDWMSELRGQDEPDVGLGNKLKNREDILDSMQDEVSEFVTKLLAGNVPLSVADECRHQMRMADEFESISDYIANLDKFDRKLRRDDTRFTVDQRADLDSLNGFVQEYMQEIIEALGVRNVNVLKNSEASSKRLRSEIKRLRRKHLDELSNGNLSPRQSVAFLASLNAYSRVHDHSYNVAESISGEK